MDDCARDDASEVQKTRERSIDPERVVPGSPSRGVRPIVVSMDFPFWIAAGEAQDPRRKEMKDVSPRRLSRRDI